MRIVHICLSQYSDGWTYQENMLSKFHKKENNDVAVMTSMLCYREGKLVEDDKTNFYDVNGVHIIRLKKIAGFMKKVPRYESFSKTLNMLAPDIIFSHGCQYADAVAVAKYCKTHPKVKLFVDNHADYSNSATTFMSKYILHKVIWHHYAQCLVPYASKYWGVLPSRVDFLVENYGIPKEKCDLLVMGADDDEVQKATRHEVVQAIREQYGVSEDEFLIVTGGKIDPWKTQTLLLMEAVKMIPGKVKLIIFGSVDETLKDKVDELTDGKKIQNIGWVKPTDSYRYFAAADLVVFPGRHSVFWEQVAGIGIPMMVKNWPGTHHVDVGGNVSFLNEDSADEIEHELERIIGHRDVYEKMKKIAIEKGKNEFLYSVISKRAIGEL